MDFTSYNSAPDNKDVAVLKRPPQMSFDDDSNNDAGNVIFATRQVNKQRNSPRRKDKPKQKKFRWVLGQSSKPVHDRKRSRSDLRHTPPPRTVCHPYNTRANSKYEHTESMKANDEEEHAVADLDTAKRDNGIKRRTVNANSDAK